MLFLLAFSIIAEAHFGLSETNCVFPLANAIKLFQLGLVNALYVRISKISHGESNTLEISPGLRRTWLGK